MATVNNKVICNIRGQRKESHGRHKKPYYLSLKMFWKISYFTNKYNLIVVKQTLQKQFLTPLLFESNYGKI